MCTTIPDDRKWRARQGSPLEAPISIGRYIAGMSDLCEQDENVVERAIETDVFRFMKDAVIANGIFYNEVSSSDTERILADFDEYHFHLFVRMNG